MCCRYSCSPITPRSPEGRMSTSRGTWRNRSPWNNLSDTGGGEMNLKIRTAVLAAATLVAGQAQAQVEIQWWHSMGGQLGEALNELANKFNAEQKDYKVVTSYKGTYPESMTAAIAAFRAGQAPHLLQVFEVGTATMMAAKGAIKPVYQLMKEQ